MNAIAWTSDGAPDAFEMLGVLLALLLIGCCAGLPLGCALFSISFLYDLSMFKFSLDAKVAAA